MKSKTLYHPSDWSPEFVEGYWDGMEGFNKNPYVEMSPEWTDYELGWEEGWLDS